MMKRLLHRRTILAALLAVLAYPAPAAADAPGPTDFSTTVLSINPETEGFEVEIIGGDSFVHLTYSGDTVLEVIGYNGEPYLRFLPDGSVEQNRLSPAVYFNEERYGSEIPDFADAEAEPEWEQVADDGSFAWHDHRAHLMAGPPINTSPGEQVLADVIPLFIDGSEVEVRVVSFWQDAPSPIPVALGTALGLGAALLVWTRRSTLLAVLGTGTALAALAGLVQYFSVPPETGPSITLIALPLIGIGCVGAAAFTRSRPATSLPLAIGASVTLLVFAGLRLPDSGKAILPTDLPMALDRGSSAFAAVVAVGCLLGAGASFLGLMKSAQPAASAA